MTRALLALALTACADAAPPAAPAVPTICVEVVGEMKRKDVCEAGR